MYRCELCNRQSKPRETPVRLVTEKRKRTYTVKRKFPQPDTMPGDDKFYYESEEVEGWEIAKEVNSCPKCADKWRKKEDAA